MYRQNKDLITVSFLGFIYYAIVIGLNGHLMQLPPAESFLIPFIIAIMMAFSLRRSSQMLEWPLCFLFGGATASVTLLTILNVLGMPMNLYFFAQALGSTFAWFGLVAVTILLGLILGTFLKSSYSLVMGSLDISMEY